MTSGDCVFCHIVSGKAPARITAEAPDAIVFEPLEPHVRGHRLVVPRQHVADAVEDPDVTAKVFRYAAFVVKQMGCQANLLTSVGPLATQTVAHLHVIPRSNRDGLHPDWPWLRELMRRRDGARPGRVR